jgi:DHA1 family tetracycline resistance protein-like MFS transporter
MTLPGIGQLMLLGFLSVLAFAALEGTLSLYLRRRMDWNARSAAFVFAGLGLLSALVQGGLIRRLVPRFGEPRLIGAGIAIVALGFAGLALASGALELAGAIVLVGVGQGLVGPSVSGLLSRITPASEQGAVFGTLSSAQTLARMISYSTANLLLGRMSTAAPYWFGFGVYLAAGLAAIRFLPRLITSLESQQSAGSVESVGAGGIVE